MLRKSSAKRIIENNVAFAIGAGLVPIPFLDFGALIAIQLRMVQNLAAEYGIEADQRKIRHLILPLLKSPGMPSLAIGGLGSLLKAIPFFGIFGTGATTILTGALTYATGRVFALHFEKGGNLSDFDLPAQRKIFVREYNSGKKVISEIRESTNHPDTGHPEKDVPIYLILKPNLGANGKVYLKTYYQGKRPEKYIGTIKALEERYNTKDLQLKENKIIKDHQAAFEAFLQTKFAS
jgi:uncharacterized protein (DUF697 family)